MCSSDLDKVIRDSWPEQVGRKAEPVSDQSVHSSDETGNDRGAKEHRKEETQ